ncbi:pyruvate synthase subunit beta [Candidatus Poribacteria bacterium]|nr:pyruvate synthase subunit beta [Candidatus Poribacteria bacterium]
MNLEKTNEEELMCSGHVACQGCGGALAMRHALQGFGAKTMVVIPACCWTIIAGAFPCSILKTPVLHTAFAGAGATAAGLRASLDMRGREDINVLVWAGDGGTFDIGLQSLSGAVERNENVTFACYDNEAYMNTGVQRSSATPLGAWTMTTPEGFPKENPKKNIVQIMAAHKIPYAATASVGFLDDLRAKFEKAGKIKGSKLIHILAPCPPGWKHSSDLTARLARLAVHCKAFPVYEVFDGEKHVINIEPDGKPVKQYLSMQGRFSHLTDQQIADIQTRVDHDWEQLRQKTVRSA